jgi:signal transduction histidine kinase
MVRELQHQEPGPRGRRNRLASAPFSFSAFPSFLVHELARHLPYKNLALLLRDPAGDYFSVHARSGYCGEVTGSVRFRYDGPLARHLSAHAVPLGILQLRALPWFPWASQEERDAIAAFEDSWWVPISTGDSLVGLLMLGDGKGRLRGGPRSPLPRLRGQLAALALALHWYHQVNSHREFRHAALGQGGGTGRAAPIDRTARAIAHDLNNSFSVMLSHAQLLERAAEDPDIRVHARAIVQAVREGALSVRGLGQTPSPSACVSAVSTDMNDMVRTTLQMLEPGWRLGRLPLPQTPGAAGQTARLLVTLGPAVYVSASPAEVRRALTNVIHNALEALPAEGGLIEITTGRDHGSAFVRVRDNGAGIPVGREEQIFRPFFTTKEGESRGLGLPISRSIAEAHGGSLRVESRPSYGATFIMELPIPSAG